MPFFRTNLGIFFNKTYLQDPPITGFVYDGIGYEDVNAWEILHEKIEGNKIVLGIYASHDPYGDFYMIKNNDEIVEFFGDKAEQEIEEYLQKNNIDYRLNDKVSIGTNTVFEEVK